MTCGKVKSLLSAYLDQELRGCEIIEIRHHLSRCEDCQEELQSLQETKMMLGNLSICEPPPGLDDSIIQNIRTFEKKALKILWQSNWPAIPCDSRRRIQYAGLCAALVLAVIVFSTPPFRNSGNKISPTTFSVIPQSPQASMSEYIPLHQDYQQALPFNPGSNFPINTVPVRWTVPGR